MQDIENNDNPENILVELLERTQKVYEIFLKELPPTEILSKHVSHFSQVYQDLLQGMINNPQRIISAQRAYWQDYFSLIQNTTLRWLGKPIDSPIDSPSSKSPSNKSPSNKSPSSKSDGNDKRFSDGNDKRFNDPIWNENPFFSFFKEFYLLSVNYIQSITNNLDGIDEKSNKKINFYTRQFIDAMSPSNFAMTNPKVLQTTIKSGGKNLLKGLDSLITDLKNNHGKFQLRMTDLNAFQVGKNIAATPGKIIYRNDLMELIQYTPQTEQVYKRPLLIIPPWINKYYIFDLSPENSFVKWIVDQGYTVFIISWVNPDARHANHDFEDYMLKGPLAALDAIFNATGESRVNAVGYCVGGTLLAATLAYMAAGNDKRIVSGTYLTTLLDFSKPGEIEVFVDELQIQLLEQEMKQKGYLAATHMSAAFNMLRNNDLIWSYYVKNCLHGEEPMPFNLLYWNSDPTNMPARMHSFYLRNMYLKNLLMKSEGIRLNNTPIDLRSIKIPVFFLSAHQDHIAPWQSTYAGVRLHSGPVKFVLSGSGHIAGVMNPPAKNKYYYYINNRKTENAEDFLNGAQMQSGSWWPHWEHWLRKRSGKKIPARTPGEGNIPSLGDAPGSYVLAKANQFKPNNEPVKEPSLST